ncbi:MAG: ABC transporter ATP-binding protein, partial [Bacillota bacterium]|nr:ABC transporter ATP-binding protein [Bacillota bacterium]
MAKNAINQDEESSNRSKYDILFKLFSYLKPYKFKVFIVIIMLILVMFCNVINPLILQLSIDKYMSKNNIKGLIEIGIIMIIMNIISMVISRYRTILMAAVTNKVLLTIRHELYTHIQKLSFSFFDNRPVGKILARVIGDVNSLNDLLTNSVTTLIPESLSILFVAVMMFITNYKLASVAVIILPILIFIMSLIENASRKRWNLYRKKRSNLNAYTHENFSGIRVVQEFAAEKKCSQTFSVYVKEMLFDGFLHAVRFNDLFWPMVEFSGCIGTIIVYWYSLKMIHAGTLSVGTLLAFTWYVTMFWKPITNLTNFYTSLVTNFASAERIFDIMDIKPDINNINTSYLMPKINGNVEFKNVTFGYEDGITILDNVSFKVNSGENIALVGPTGAGKTTIISLISRFYDTIDGEVLIDGHNVKNVDLESLRSQMGIMLQDTFLFSETVRENIRYGRLDASDEEIISAAKAVNAHGFIMKLEKGYDTVINERGSRLSVGQRQLISFARALLADPRILILDEATSNIDTYTERLVQKGIKKLL